MGQFRKILWQLGYDYQAAIVWLISLAIYILSVVLLITLDYDFIFAVLGVLSGMTGTAAYFSLKE